MEHNFREQENSVKMNFGEHQNLFLGNKLEGEIAIFCREQGNIHPPPPPHPGRPSSVQAGKFSARFVIYRFPARVQANNWVYRFILSLIEG